MGTVLELNGCLRYKPRPHAVIRPSHTLRCCTPAMGSSKDLAMHQNFIFQHVGNLASDFGIFQLITVQLSDDFQQNEGNLICCFVINN